MKTTRHGVRCVANCIRRALPRRFLARQQNAAPFSSESRRDRSDVDKILQQADPSILRNFSIIAHVDHGKSTLSDRLLQLTGTVKQNERAQYLDKLQVERERGITVKAQTATLVYERDGIKHVLNLIDTPGHVDFSYEVSRSLAACEGVLLLVDASQGIQAQTLANYLLAKQFNLTILPVVNKIDLPSADLPRVTEQIQRAFGVSEESVLYVSGKSGKGTEDLLEAIVDRIPAPKGDKDGPLQAVVFDTWFDTYRGVVLLLRLKEGSVKVGDRVMLKSTQKWYEVHEVGVMHPEPQPVTGLYAGHVGYIISNMKHAAEARVGDTLVNLETTAGLEGFKAPVPMVYAGIYPMDSSEFDQLNKSIEKLVLNDSSVWMSKESSNALGLGFRCGFLGLLHMEVFRQRLEQEYEANVIITNPTVPFKLRLRTHPDKDIVCSNPSLFPDPATILSVEEPVVTASIITPSEYMGDIMTLCKSRRGVQESMDFLDSSQVLFKFLLPLSEVVVDFYDALKSLSKGYASLDYDPAGYRTADVVKLQFSLNGSPVDALTTIVHRSSAETVGRTLAVRLKEALSRQQFQV